MILLHVDDFLAGGSGSFESDIVEPMLKQFCFGSVSNSEFTYTGISINQDGKSKCISMNQKQFVEDLPIHSYIKQDLQKVLNENENNLLRKSTGQLNWLS